MKVNDVLRQFKGRRIKYYPNSGNAGDSLINCGFYHIAEQLKLDYELINRHDVVRIDSDDVVIIGGGGAFVPEWPSTQEFVTELAGLCSSIIVLPQSFRAVDGVLRLFGKDDILFCRERYSYQYCKSLSLRCTVLLDHDMAFKADVNRLLSYNGAFPARYTLKNIVRFFLYAYHRQLASKISRSIDAFRCDKEANVLVKKRRLLINDLSAICRFAAGGIEQSSYSASKFLKIIDGYERVATDRLHVGVACAMLGKEVILSENSYYKVRGVAEYSLNSNAKIKLAQYD